MKYFAAEELAKIGEANILGNSSAIFKGVTYDSRSVVAENLFVAVKGEKVDGNDYIEKAFENGASVVLSSRKINPPEGCALVYSASPEKTIENFAASLREKFGGRVIGIIGSVGKTTTKDFCTKFLSEIDLTYSNEGNKNNLLGVPQTIVNADFEAKYWVLEMGISTPSEMDALAKIVKPNIVLFTAIKPVHLEFLKSIDNVLLEKSKALNYLVAPSFYIYNKDDSYLNKLPQMFNIESHSFGMSNDSDLRFEIVERLGIDGFKVDFDFGKQSCTLSLPFLNMANIYNFAGAFLLSLILNGDIKIGEKVLNNLPTSSHRGIVYRLKNGAILYDDSYNSNPEAVKTLLQSAKSWGKKIIAVLGEMKELGEDSEQYHKETGQFSSEILSSLFCVGGKDAEIMFETFKKSNKPCSYSSDWKDGKDFLKSKMDQETIIIVKGSRAIALDKLVEDLIKEIGVNQ